MVLLLPQNTMNPSTCGRGPAWIDAKHRRDFRRHIRQVGWWRSEFGVCRQYWKKGKGKREEPWSTPQRGLQSAGVHRGDWSTFFRCFPPTNTPDPNDQDWRWADLKYAGKRPSRTAVWDPRSKQRGGFSLRTICLKSHICVCGWLSPLIVFISRQG